MDSVGIPWNSNIPVKIRQVPLFAVWCGGIMGLKCGSSDTIWLSLMGVPCPIHLLPPCLSEVTAHLTFGSSIGASFLASAFCAR